MAYQVLLPFINSSRGRGRWYISSIKYYPPLHLEYKLDPNYVREDSVWGGRSPGAIIPTLIRP